MTRDVQEYPPPAQRVDQQASREWASHRAESERADDQAEIATTLPDRDDRPDRRVRKRREPARSGTLQRTKPDELRKRSGKAAQQRPDEKERDSDDQRPLLAQQVPQLSVQRDGDRRSQDVGSKEPRIAADSSDVCDDRGPCGGDDRLVESRKEDHEHQREVDREDAPHREAIPLRLGGQARRQCRGRRGSTRQLAQPPRTTKRGTARPSRFWICNSSRCPTASAVVPVGCAGPLIRRGPSASSTM